MILMGRWIRLGKGCVGREEQQAGCLGSFSPLPLTGKRKERKDARLATHPPTHPHVLHPSSSSSFVGVVCGMSQMAWFLV